jgi:hypothetical protein
MWVLPLEVKANKTIVQSIPNAGFTIECTSLYLDSSFISSYCSPLADFFYHLQLTAVPECEGFYASISDEGDTQHINN